MASKALLLLAALVAPSQAAIAAWWTGIGPQIILQNKTTGAIRHSACNSFGTPYYSYTDGSEVPLSYKPRKDTPLAGTGYWDSATTIASIYYLDENGSIANALLECNMATGRFKSNGNWIISGSEVDVSNSTGLAALLLGKDGGYRVYFNSFDKSIHELGYTRDTGWEYRGIISRDPQDWGAIGAAFSGEENITVASARDYRSVEVARYNSDGNWRISTLPYSLQGNITTQDTNASLIAINETAPVNFTLAAWEGTPRSLGVSIDSEYTRSVWYIGNDRQLYQVKNKNYFWSQNTNQSSAFWPAADEPNAEFGTASEHKSSMVRHYYFVKGQLAEIKYDNGAWKAWAAIAAPKAAAVTDSPTSPPAATSTAASAAQESTGLSTGAKAGVGVGVALGVIALGVLGATFFLIRKRRNAPPPEPPAPIFEQPSPVPPYGSPAPRPDSQGYDPAMWEKKGSPQPQYHVAYAPAPAQLDAIGRPMELDTARPMELDAPRPMYELPDQTLSHELVADATHRPPVHQGY